MAQIIRERLRGSMDIFDAFPAQTQTDALRTYNQLHLRHDAAKERSVAGLNRTTLRSRFQ
jgi:hypothetical protein